jgi:hypothetical protein
MTRTFTLLAALSFTGALHAQLLDLFHGTEPVANGSVYTVEGPADESVITVYFKALINGEESRLVNVKRYELDVQPGTANYFCWYLCYGAVDAGASPFWAAPNQHALTMAPGDTLSNFSAYHEPWGHVGQSSYRYVWYDITQPSDSVWLDIVFNSTATGVEEYANVRRFSVYPNPSMGQNVDILLELSTARDAALVVYDMLGSRVRIERIAATQTRTTLHVADMAPGVYFAAVEQSGRAVATRRFVVTH